MLRTTLTVAAGLVLGATVLTGCGSSSKNDDNKTAASGRGEYCAALKANQAEFASFTGPTASPDLSKFGELTATMNSLAKQSPKAVAGDWALLTGDLNALTDALATTNVKLTDVVGAMATGKLPKGMTQKQWTDVGAKIAALQSAEIKSAGDAINADAKKECGVDLQNAG